MKKLRMLLAVCVGIAGLWAATSAWAGEDEPAPGKELTLKGEGKCGKCALKETAKCQNVIQVEGKDGKKVTYYLAENQLSKDFHKNLCSGSKKVTATGKVKKVEGKNELTVSKLELVKE